MIPLLIHIDLNVQEITFLSQVIFPDSNRPPLNNLKHTGPRGIRFNTSGVIPKINNHGRGHLMAIDKSFWVTEW
jgi:hypothetical protein